MSKKKKWQQFYSTFMAYEWVWLLLILPFAMFPSPARSPVLLLLPVLWFMRWRGQGHFVPATPADWPLFGLLLMVLVSLYATFDISFSFGKIAGLVYGVAVFYGVVAYARQSHRHLWRAVFVFLLLGLGLVVLGLLGTQWTRKFAVLQPVLAVLPAQVLANFGASAGFNPNQIAGVLLFVAPLAFLLAGLVMIRGRVLWRQVRPYQAILIILFVMGMAVTTGGLLFLTQSRGGLLGLGVGVLFMIFAAIWYKNRTLLLILLLVLVIGLGIFMASGPWEQAVDLIFAQTGLDPDSSQINTLTGRVEIWSRALYGIQDFPFTGMGMNNFRRVVPILYPLFTISPDVDIAHAHNHLLQAALDLGLPGLVAYLALWLLLALLLWQSWRQAQSLWLRELALGMAGSLLAHFVYGMLDAVALGAKPGFVFWYLAGLVVSLREVVRKSAAEPNI